jgi:hypothetical protein
MLSSSWAAHPNPALRLEIARYLGRGWKVHHLGERSAILVKPRRFSFAKYLFLTPFYLMFHLFERDQAMRIVADAAGTATWRTRVPVPHGGLGPADATDDLAADDATDEVAASPADDTTQAR